MKYTKKILGMMILLSSTPALTAGLSAPMSLDGTAVLPKGIRNLRYTGVVIKGEEKFDNNGESTIIADPFFKNVKFEDLIKGKDAQKPAFGTKKDSKKDINIDEFFDGF